jgi:hypothetical protein
MSQWKTPNPQYTSALLVVVALATAFWQKYLSIEQIGFAVLITGFLVIIAIYATEMLTRTLNPTRRIPHFLADPELMEYERTAVGEVWIATRDMLYDLDTFLPVVRNNIIRGVTYKYLLPEENEVVGKFRHLKRIVTGMVSGKTNSPGLLLARCLERFPFIYEWGVYCPSAPKPPQGFIVMPELRSEFNFLLNPEMTLRLIDLFEAEWDRGTPVD